MSLTQKKPHIALFLPALYEGGAERVMVKLANAFAARGHRVDLVLATKDGPYLGEVAGNVKIIDLGCQRVATAVWPLMRYLRDSQPESILSTLTHANIVAIIAVKLSWLPIKVVVREAGLPTLNTNQSLGSKPKGIMRIAQLIYPYANHIISVSNGVENELIDFLDLERKVKHSVIYNPVISNQLYRMAGIPIAQELEKIFDKPVILGVGRLAPEKDFDTLVEAFATARASLDCNLLILGSGELESSLTEKAKQLGVANALFMPGFINNPYPFLKRCSVFVLSSVSEGLPNALIEALALGSPVVSTIIDNGPAEITDNGKWGKLVPVGDCSVMSSAIIAAIQSPSNPIPAREDWWDRFSEQSVIDKYLHSLQ